jgi:Mg2+-importing ATPase
VSTPPRDAFWRAGADRLLASLAASAQGLTSAEVARRLGRDGSNLVAASPHRRLPARFARRLAEPLIAILIAAAVAGATGDLASMGIIIGIVVVSVTPDVLQEHRAERAAALLRRSVAIRCTVRRDGREQELPTEALVAGDMVRLRAGDLVPADGVVLASHAATANEALLTGEAYPASKRPGPSDAAIAAEAHDALFGGTALVGGDAMSASRSKASAMWRARPLT